MKEVLLPFSLLYLGTILEQQGTDVTIIDQRLSPQWQEEFAEGLNREKPASLGISSMTGFQIKGGIEAAGILRARFPDVPIIWGGVHPSLIPQQTLEDERVDVVVKGEGERTLPDLVTALEAKKDLRSVRGIAFKANGETVVTEPQEPFPMDDLPELSFHLFDTHKYIIEDKETGRKSLPILTSKGCGHTCAYCYNIQFNKRRYRTMSPERVLSEIRRMLREFGLNALFLIDDNFFQNRKRVQSICEGILKEGFDLHFNNANCRVDYVARYNPDFLELIRKAGIRELRMGIESGSDSVQKDILKHTTFDQAVRANRKLRDAGIRPFYNFMVGFPTEGADEIRATLKLMSVLLDENPESVILGCSIFTPYPGTHLFHESVAKGWESPGSLKEWVDYDWCNLNPLHYTRKHITRLNVSAFLSNHLDPKFQKNRLMRLHAALMRGLLKRDIFPFLLSLLHLTLVKWKQTLFSGKQAGEKDPEG